VNKLAISVLIALAAPLAAHASDTATVRAEGAAVKATTGKMLYSGNYRVAPVYRVTTDGSPQVVLDGKLVTVPASTLSDVGGKLTTSLSKKELANTQ
jgi:hypothetical protein